MNRRNFLSRASSALAAVMTAGCGGSAATPSLPATSAPPPPAPPVAPPAPSAVPTTPPGSVAPPVGPSGPGLPVLTLHSAQAGALPYFATAYPREGAVPAGSSIVSPDDPTLRASILSAWPDGSAQVAVVAGTTSAASGASKSIRLQAGASSGSALTPADIQSRFSAGGIQVDFGGGVQALTDFNKPDWIWWANPQVICARYRLPCGLGALEAAIDVHALAGGRAFVEVVIENGKTNCDAATVTAPILQKYTGATVAVNGTTIATVSSPTAGMLIPRCRRGAYTYEQSYDGHEAGRAWYCSAWVSNGVATAEGGASDYARPPPPRLNVSREAPRLWTNELVGALNRKKGLGLSKSGFRASCLYLR